MPFRTRYPLVRYLSVAVIDHEYRFLNDTLAACKSVGIINLLHADSAAHAEEILLKQSIDVVFLDYSQKYSSCWDLIGSRSDFTSVVVATTRERSGRTWLSALRAGADRVIVKQQAHAVLLPMLLHLSEGELSGRFHVVPFPARPARAQRG